MKIFFKYFFCLFLTCIGRSSIAQTRDSIQIISVNVDITGYDKHQYELYPKSGKHYFTTITLTNTQDTAITICSMACSWASSFITDTKLISLSGQPCDNDVADIIHLKPHKSIKYFAVLIAGRKDEKESVPERFKIGFVDMSVSALYFYIKDPSKHKIYWSSEIVLKSELNTYKIAE